MVPIDVGCNLFGPKNVGVFPALLPISKEHLHTLLCDPEHGHGTLIGSSKVATWWKHFSETNHFTVKKRNLQIMFPCIHHPPSLIPRLIYPKGYRAIMLSHSLVHQSPLPVPPQVLELCYNQLTGLEELNQCTSQLLHLGVGFNRITQLSLNPSHWYGLMSGQKFNQEIM